jgi:hypothetical protein
VDDPANSSSSALVRSRAAPEPTPMTTPSAPKPRPNRWRAALAAGAWFGATLTGFGWLSDYSNDAGNAGNPPTILPTDLGIATRPDRATLFVVLHPRCPCSRATVDELARLLARCGGAVDAHALFLAPAGTDPGWTHTDLWDQAAAIPGLDLLADADGRLEQRLGVLTSGHVLLYAAGGRLLFSGGITSSRGHAGDNVGEELVVALAGGERAEPGTAPVFGCPLTEHADRIPSCPR